jgi:hypothetical protein
MALDGSLKPADPATKRLVKNAIVVASVLVIAAYLAGFLPSYAKGKRLENELREARLENRMAQLRDLVGLAYLQASQKNYGLAAGTSARFFERARAAATEQPDSGSRKALEDLLSVRDKITAELAKADAAVLNDLQTLFMKTRQTTEIASGASPTQ